MELVMRHKRLENGMWYKFHIDARFACTEEESGLLTKYKLRNVALTEGDTWRDLKKATWFAVPVSTLFFFVFFGVSLLNLPFLILLLVLSTPVIFTQIRQRVVVEEVLQGRDFKARSFVDLLNRENEIKKMAAVFAEVVVQARTWEEPEVIDLTPEPLLSELGGDRGIA